MRTAPPSVQVLIVIAISAALAALFVAYDAHHQRVERELAEQRQERAERLSFEDRYFPVIYLDIRNALATPACNDRCRLMEAER